MRKFGEGLTSKQIALARAIEKAHIATYSQAIKNLQRKDPIIEEWIKELNKKDDK